MAKTKAELEYDRDRHYAIMIHAHRAVGQGAIADAEALQYRQSLTMSDEDQQFIERVFDEAEDELNITGLEEVEA
jgi:hypothetical protein